MVYKILKGLIALLISFRNAEAVKVDFFESMKAGGCVSIDSVKNDEKWLILKNLYDKNFLVKKVSTPIPKKIHQVWLGPKPVPQTMLRCKDSLLKYNPDWEYKLWQDQDIETFNLSNKNAFNWEVNWGAKSDIARYEILEREGGVYLDHDFECLAALNDLHETSDFYCGLCDDPNPVLLIGIIGSIPHHPVLKMCIDNIKTLGSKYDPNAILRRTGPLYFTQCFMSLVNEIDNPMVILPSTYFYAFPGKYRHYKDRNKIMQWVKPESLLIHHWATSWY